MVFPKREIVEKIRKEYPVGCEVVLDRMDDVQAPPVGTHGIVRSVDDTASIRVAWRTGGSLSVVYGEDACHRIDTDVTVKEFLDDYGKTQAAGKCPRCATQSAGGRTSSCVIFAGRRRRWKMPGCQGRNRCLHGRHGRREENEPQKNACLRGTYLTRKWGPVLIQLPPPIYRIFSLNPKFSKWFLSRNVHNLLRICLAHVWYPICLLLLGSDGNMSLQKRRKG